MHRCLHRNKTTSVEEDRLSTNSHTDNMESLVLDHDKPGSGDDIPTASTSSVQSNEVEDIERERLMDNMEDCDRDESASVSVESGGCQTIVPLSGESEQTHNSSDKVNWSPLVQRRDQVNTEVELERIGDSDEDTLLGGDNIQTSTHASRIRSRLMKMLKEICSGFIKSLIDLKFFMR